MTDELRSSRSLQVFLCHSSNDKPAVRELYKKLRAKGVKPWLDEEDLLPGQDWNLEIPRAVRKSDVVIVCISRESVNKAGYVQKEIKLALDAADEQPEGSIFIIPLKLEECDVPERLSRWHWANLFEENGFERLMRALKARSDELGIAIGSYHDNKKMHDNKNYYPEEKVMSYKLDIPMIDIPRRMYRPQDHRQNQQNLAHRACLVAQLVHGKGNNDYRLRIENKSAIEARDITVLLDGKPILEHPAIPQGIGGEIRQVGPWSYFQYLLAISFQTHPPFEVNITWTDDSGEPGSYRTTVTP